MQVDDFSGWVLNYKFRKTPLYRARDNDSAIQRHKPEVSLLIVTNGLSSMHPNLLLQQPPVGQGLLIIQASRSLSDIPQSAGLLWMRDQFVSETST